MRIRIKAIYYIHRPTSEKIPDYVRDGDKIKRIFEITPKRVFCFEYRTPRFMISVLEYTSPSSSASPPESSFVCDSWCRLTIIHPVSTVTITHYIRVYWFV